MIALHVSILNGKPFLWSEAERIGDIRDLRTAIKAVGLDLKVLKRNTDPMVIWLPARGDSPVPSSPLIAAEPDRRRKTRHIPFQITARALSVEEWLSLTTLSREGNIPDTGVIFGSSLHWSADLARLIADLVITEAFLPAITANEDQWEARWQPVPGEDQEHRLATLAESMPAVCRSLSKEETGQTPPETPSRAVINSLVAYGVDALVRSANRPTSDRRPQAESVHDSWLDALCRPDPPIRWKDREQLQEFAEQLRKWRRTADITLQSPFKLCFRVTEPPEDEDESAPTVTGSGKWRVDYLIQPKADQSLLLPVADIWKKNSQTLQRLKAYGDDPTEFVLTALGQASGLCPHVADSLKKKHPWGFKLETKTAYTFLRQHVEALQSAGFTVMLPSWWLGRGPRSRMGIKAKTKTSKMQGSGQSAGLDALVAFDYAASLNGEELTLEELEELAALKTPLVKVRGQWTQIDTEEVKKAISFLEKNQQETMSGHDLLSVALGGEKEEDGVRVHEVELDGWLQELVDRLAGQQPLEELPVPGNFRGELRHYQNRGYSWLDFLRRWGLGACLADDMGLGKTVQTLALIQRERGYGEKRPVLLVVPTTVINNWRKEAERFTPNLQVHLHHGSTRYRHKAFHNAVSDYDIVVSSYGLLHRDIDFLKNVDWAGVVLDEAHNIKNPETKQAKAARSLQAAYRVALTGTPIENHVGDIWSLMEFLNPGLLGSQTSFKNNFYRPIQRYGDSQAAEKLKSLTTPFILRREKTDKSIISDLPDKQEMKEYCSLTKEQASLYEAVVQDMQDKLSDAEEMERRGVVLATLSKLKQVCNHPAQFAADNSAIAERSGKTARLIEMLEEIREEGHRTLVFTQFSEMGSMLQKRLQEYFGEEVFFLYGGLQRKKRDEMISRFQHDEHAPHIFILSLKAGGTGLNLDRANHVIHYDRWWNPAVENQATDRAFRIGQRRDVQVYKYLVAGTLEERIDSMIESKTEVADQVLGTGEQWLTELSDSELHDLVKLDKDAVE